MPAKAKGVYRDGRRGRYIKLRLPADPLTGRREQVTRGFATAGDAAAARRELLSKIDCGRLRSRPGAMTVDQLLDDYLGGVDADGRLSPKTCFDYRHYADDYIRLHLGSLRVRDVTPETVTRWQRKLAKEGGRKNGKPLAANTVRLARCPLAGAFKLAVTRGLVASSPAAAAPAPKPQRSLPRHWSPAQALDFLGLLEGDRTWPLWAFLMGSGLRIGELVWLRWDNVDLSARVVHIVEFTSTLGHDLVPSAGKSRDAVRSVDLDDHLVDVLRKQQDLQARERAAAGDRWTEGGYVFTDALGASYHPHYLSKLLGRYSSELGLPRLTAHGLWHTSATLMLASGVPPKVAAERLGHADPTLFTNLYSHVTPTMQRDAAERLGQMLFGGAGDTSTS